MAKLRLGSLFSLGFISGCFCLGLGIGVFIRFGQEQRSDAATTTELQLPFVIPNNEQTPTDTITIKAVGDVIPGTNFPTYRLPCFP
jgi:hypothetical protein